MATRRRVSQKIKQAEGRSCKISKGRCDNMSDGVCHTVLITVLDQRSGKKKKKQLCAAVLMQSSQLDVSCIGCHCEKLFFSPSRWCKTWRHMSGCTPTQKPINTHTHTRCSGFAKCGITYVSSPASLVCHDFKRFIIVFVNAQALSQALQLSSNPKMNSTSPPTQPKGTK